MTETLAWIGIGACLIHSGMFSGLNLAVLGLSRLQLEVEAEGGSVAASRILDLRRDSNFLLTTILWGNVGVNCLLTLLSESLLAGASAFLFSTIGITLLGEILPQAWFSRNAMTIGSRLVPVIHFYQWLLFPVARPTAIVLDFMLGPEGPTYFREKDLGELLRKHIHAEDSDIGHREGVGAINFLALDDLPIREEGEPVDPKSVLSLPVQIDLPVIPAFECTRNDPFIRKVQSSRRKWIILTDPGGIPQLVLDADAFLRAALGEDQPCDAYTFCHRPVVVSDPTMRIGEVIPRLRVESERPDDDVIDRDLILLWGVDDKRVITGADLLGRLMRGIVPPVVPSPPAEPPPDGTC